MNRMSAGNRSRSSSGARQVSQNSEELWDTLWLDDSVVDITSKKSCAGTCSCWDSGIGNGMFPDERHETGAVSCRAFHNTEDNWSESSESSVAGSGSHVGLSDYYEEEFTLSDLTYENYTDDVKLCLAARSKRQPVDRTESFRRSDSNGNHIPPLRPHTALRRLCPDVPHGVLARARSLPDLIRSRSLTRVADQRVIPSRTTSTKVASPVTVSSGVCCEHSRSKSVDTQGLSSNRTSNVTSPVSMDYECRVEKLDTELLDFHSLYYKLFLNG